MPRQLAELLQLSVEEVCADFDAMLRHDSNPLGICAEAGDARVVHFVETLHGLVAVVLSALQQVMHGHGAAVVVDVVAALVVGKDLDEAGGVGRGRGQRVGAVRVPDAEGDLDGLGVDEERGRGGRRGGVVRRVGKLLAAPGRSG